MGRTNAESQGSAFYFSVRNAILPTKRQATAVSATVDAGEIASAAAR